MTLAETIKAATNYNFEIKAQGQRVKTAEAEQTAAYTKFLPSVRSSATFAKDTYTNDTYRNSMYANKHTTNTAIEVRQSLFNGGADAYGVQASTYSLSSSKEDLRNMINNVLFRTIQSYEDLSTKRAVLKLNEENVKLYDEFLSLNQTRFELGEITATDIAQTKARLAEAVASKEQATADVLAAEATFKNLVGTNAPENLSSINLDTSQLPVSLSALLQAVKKSNPALLSSRNKSEAAKKNVSIARAQLLPDVDAVAAFNYNDNKAKNLNSSGAVYSLQARMPIFQSGTEYATIKKSKHQREEAKYNLSKTETALEADAITSWNNYNISNSIIASKKQAIDASEKSLAGVREETKMGTRTTLDVLTEQTNLFQAKVAYRRAIQNHVISFYAIYNLLGQLDSIKYS